MIIIDLKNNNIIADNFEVIEDKENEETIIKSNWNKGYSVSCNGKIDLIKELISMILE